MSTMYCDDLVLGGTAYQPEEFGQQTGSYADDMVYSPPFIASAPPAPPTFQAAWAVNVND